MRSGRAVLALFLLFSYTLGVAQHMLPNCYHPSIQEAHHTGSQDRHQIPKENKDRDPARKFMLHKDHFDSGLLCFILCVLKEAEHTPDDMAHQLCQAIVYRAQESTNSASEAPHMPEVSDNSMTSPASIDAPAFSIIRTIIPRHIQEREISRRGPPAHGC